MSHEDGGAQDGKVEVRTVPALLALEAAALEPPSLDKASTIDEGRATSRARKDGKHASQTRLAGCVMVVVGAAFIASGIGSLG